MGLGKFIKKAVKSVTKVAAAPIAAAAGIVNGKQPDAPQQEVQAPPPPAVAVTTPDTQGDVQQEADTESTRKRSARSGKRALSVTRSSGGGLNI
ncbi:host range and adsorption protein [Pectobacterium phage PPWS4]|uniref:Putative tail assembly protein n=1 Tax=Pectobacterium phage PPWS4 TaxID=1961914 RepID=A0A250KA88_9CAUD|nr:host range and adsorption protein [Pectobacterium phage PPWS4]BBA26448.1 putative tail assembly protein [Pectobacterium phage PPWS4]